MKVHKPKLKDFPDQALIILVNQKQDKKFTKYVKAILLERYLSENMNLQELSKKVMSSKSDFQKEILWEAISSKLLVEKDNNQIIRACYLMEKMPIDNLIPLTQHAQNLQVKSQAQKICRQKEIRLEEELDLDFTYYDKYEQDEKYIETKEQHQRQKPRISQKRQFDLSITTRKFLQDFYGLSCLSTGRLSHEEMEQIIYEEGLNLPRRGRIQNISLDQVATGKYILVRNETNKSNQARIIPYMNPYGSSLERLSEEMGIPYTKKV